MDKYADYFAALVEELVLKNAVHVGHSTGGGEVARYIGRHGTRRVAKVVLIGSITPLMLKTAANPGGLPIDAFDKIRAGVLSDRSRRRPDRPDWRLGSPVIEAREGLDAEGLSGPSARHVLDSQGPDQR